MWLTATALIALAGTANATVIYDNGFEDQLGGNNPFSADGKFVAQDFTLGADADIRALTFNALTDCATKPISAVDVRVYSDPIGGIGSLKFSGSFNVVSTTPTGTWNQFTLNDFAVNLPTWHLYVGTYWLALKTIPQQFHLHWTVIAPGNEKGYVGGYEFDPTAPTVVYDAYDFDHAFRLYDTALPTVPEPGTLALAMLGGIGVAFGSWRRKRQALVAA